MENNNTQLVITGEAKSYLLETAKWAKFIAIMGFIVMGFMLLMGLVTSFLSRMMPSVGIFKMGGATVIGYGIFLIVIAVVYLYPLYCLWKFAVRTREAIFSDDTLTMTDSFRWLKKYYKFIGIFIIVLLALYVLFFIGAFILGGLRGLM